MSHTAEPQFERNRRRNRWMLVLLFGLFVGSFVLAGVLRFSGWRPATMKNKGELLQPPADLRALQPTLRDGGHYQWHPEERLWRIVVAPPAQCGQPCVDLASRLDTVWQLFGHNADHVQMLWLGAPPAGAKLGPAVRVLDDNAAVRAALPRANDPRGVPVYVVDPNGFVILRYAPGFDPGDLRTDVARLLKLK